MTYTSEKSFLSRIFATLLNSSFVLMRSAVLTFWPSDRCTLSAGDSSKATKGARHSVYSLVMHSDVVVVRLTQDYEDDKCSPVKLSRCLSGVIYRYVRYAREVWNPVELTKYEVDNSSDNRSALNKSTFGNNSKRREDSHFETQAKTLNTSLAENLPDLRIISKNSIGISCKLTANHDRPLGSPEDTSSDTTTCSPEINEPLIPIAIACIKRSSVYAVSSCAQD